MMMIYVCFGSQSFPPQKQSVPEMTAFGAEMTVVEVTGAEITWFLGNFN